MTLTSNISFSWSSPFAIKALSFSFSLDKDFHPLSHYFEKNDEDLIKLFTEEKKQKNNPLPLNLPSSNEMIQRNKCLQLHLCKSRHVQSVPRSYTAARSSEGGRCGWCVYSELMTLGLWYILSASWSFHRKPLLIPPP